MVINIMHANDIAVLSNVGLPTHEFAGEMATLFAIQSVCAWALNSAAST